MNARPDAPIYAQLIRERGDVPSEVREVAEETLRNLERAMNWGHGFGMRGPGPDAFGRGLPVRHGAPGAP
ncbi:hypothetical protein [Streptomyces sp. SP18CS02]|uniref:hypothetical protein n=1 Tax=Streptomyces sp. SP18CS02 TaxID=3002531 RepID=UPI002E76DF28|nr:hypothetical protein [Streptomyces sp. SP18CS02]MEE1754625.1 hypothetical protein [Streptomyces sp. SP18CS02]